MLAHRMCELPNFEAILLTVLYTHTQMRVWLQKQGESCMSLKRKVWKMNHCIVQRNPSVTTKTSLFGLVSNGINIP